MQTSIKTCFKCNKSLPVELFYRHTRMSDGRLNKCKDCTISDAKVHRRSDKYREKVLQYDRERKKLNAQRTKIGRPKTRKKEPQ